MPLDDGTLLMASDGSRQLDADGTARMASATNDSCCCGCPCDPEAIPSCITVDITNLELDESDCILDDGAVPDPCAQPDPEDGELTACHDVGVCHYVTGEACGTGGWEIYAIEVLWDDTACIWVGIVNMKDKNPPWYRSYTCTGTSTDPADPTGTYTPNNGCPYGTFSVS